MHLINLHRCPPTYNMSPFVLRNKSCAWARIDLDLFGWTWPLFFFSSSSLEEGGALQSLAEFSLCLGECPSMVIECWGYVIIESGGGHYHLTWLSLAIYLLFSSAMEFLWCDLRGISLFLWAYPMFTLNFIVLWLYLKVHVMPYS